MRAALLLAVAACTGAPAPPRAPEPPAPAAPAPAPQPATHVVTLAPGVATAVVAGPFLIHTINPGNDLELALSATPTCDDALWFTYSGGGTAVAAGQHLCAHSRATAPITHGFSGTH